MYRLGDNAFTVVRVADGSTIKCDLADPDYVAYIGWVNAGNAPSPVPQSVAIRMEIEAIERSTGVVRLVREGLMRAAERAAREDAAALTAAGTPTTSDALLAQQVGYVRAKAVDDHIAQLRGLLA